METIDLAALIASGSLKSYDTESESHAYSSIYLSDEFVMKVPKENDFAHWEGVNLSVGDYLDRLPHAGRKDYESLKEAFGLRAACYTVWVERLEPVNLLAHPRKVDGFACNVFGRQCSTTACVTV